MDDDPDHLPQSKKVKENLYRGDIEPSGHSSTTLPKEELAIMSPSTKNGVLPEFETCLSLGLEEAVESAIDPPDSR